MNVLVLFLRIMLTLVLGTAWVAFAMAIVLLAPIAGFIVSCQLYILMVQPRRLTYWDGSTSYSDLHSGIMLLLGLFFALIWFLGGLFLALRLSERHVAPALGLLFDSKRKPPATHRTPSCELELAAIE